MEESKKDTSSPEHIFLSVQEDNGNMILMVEDIDEEKTEYKFKFSFHHDQHKYIINQDISFKRALTFLVYAYSNNFYSDR